MDHLLWVLLALVIIGTVYSDDQLVEEQRRNPYNKQRQHDESNFYSSYRVATGFSAEPNAPIPQAYYLVPVQPCSGYSGKGKSDHIVSDVRVTQNPNSYSYQVYEQGPHHLKEIRQAAYTSSDKLGDKY